MLSIFCVHCTDESKNFIWMEKSKTNGLILKLEIKDLLKVLLMHFTQSFTTAKRFQSQVSDQEPTSWWCPASRMSWCQAFWAWDASNTSCISSSSPLPHPGQWSAFLNGEVESTLFCLWPGVRALLEHQHGDVDKFLAETVLGSWLSFPGPTYHPLDCYIAFSWSYNFFLKATFLKLPCLELVLQSILD